MKFEFIDHTADQQVRAYGKDIPEAFAHCAEGMFAIIVKTEGVKPKLIKPVKVSAKRLESLLYEFLEQLLFLLDTEGFLLHEARNVLITKQGDKYTLTCNAAGDTDEGYDVAGNIKSITYHQMKISRGNTKVTIDFVVDI